MGIGPVKLVAVLVLLKLVSASDKIDKEHYYKSLTSEERQEIFNTNDLDHVPDFEIIHVDFPRVQKRSLDRSFPLTLPLANKNVMLNLKHSVSLIGPNTPLHAFRTNNGQIFHEKQLPFTDYSANIYEDEDQSASVVVNVDANGNRYINTGIIESQNITIHRAPNHQNPGRLGDYIVRFLNAIINGGDSSPVEHIFRTPTNPLMKIPDVIYPEILLMIDSSVYKKYNNNFDAFTNYILNYWTSVNQKYKSLSQPKYKLSIAGIAVAEDDYAFSFIKTDGVNLNFNSALEKLGVWLYRYQNIIPTDSYDVAIVHTLLNAVDSDIFSKTLGLANLQGACRVNIYEGVLKIGIVYDDVNYGFVNTAAHELAHLLGASHDDLVGCAPKQYIMSAYSDLSMRTKNLGWSQCSIRGFHNFLRTNPECLFNVPEQYQTTIQTTPVIPPPKVDVGIDNRIDDSTKTNEDNSNGKRNKNDRKGRNSPIIPQEKRDQVIPDTNTKYSDLQFIPYTYHASLMGDLEEIFIDMKTSSLNTVIYIQVVGQSDVYIWSLERASQNTFVLPGRNEAPGITVPWSNNGVASGNDRVQVIRPNQPIAEILFPERVNKKYNFPVTRSDNGAPQTGLSWSMKVF